MSEAPDTFEAWLERWGCKPDCDSFCPPGWLPLLERTAVALDKAGWTRGLGQVKEKFGGLRIYLHHFGGEKDGTALSRETWDAMHDILVDAERESFTICDMCGQTGSLRSERPNGERRHWIRTLCDTHAETE